MKIKILKLIAVSACAISFIFALKSCKKIDSKNNISNQKTKEEIIADFKAKNPNIGIETITQINEKFAYSYYADKNGVEHLIGKRDGTANSDIATTSGFTHCSSKFCPDPTDADGTGQIYDPEQQVNSMGRFYFCTRGTSDISFSWNISVPNTFVSANPLNSAQKSVGKIWLKTSANATIISNLAIIPSITLLGTDPNCSFHNIYRVDYTLANIPQSLFSNNPGYKFSTQVLIYFGCNDYMQYYLSPLSTYTNTSTYGGVEQGGNGSFLSPCQRTDICYTNGPSPTYATVIGGYTFCTYLPAYPTNLQRYEYRKKTSLTSNAWSSQSSNILWGRNPSTDSLIHDMSPYTGFLRLDSMTVGSGTWIVRYRNVTTPTDCSPESPWIEEVYTF
ncbi:MAG: hypothetical protein JSU03_12685 [Bacteroidetes bacterium]|nr:hypothetical protein [Bacteroidota bacterium]